MDLVSYTFVLLRRGPRAAEYEGEELDRLQAAHLAYLDSMREQGHMLAGGPFDDQPHDSWRGFSLYRTGIEETRALAEADPSVRAGRLQVDVMTWWTKRGAVEFPQARSQRTATCHAAEARP
jgi:uncharacterized protein YciI